MHDDNGEAMDMDELARLLEEIEPSGYAHTLFRDRPYNGQPHTDCGERGKTEVKGVTFRDLRDCFIRACYESSGLEKEQYPKTLYKLPRENMDPIAVFQNMSCEIERLMGIYPNVPPLKYTGDDAEVE